MFRKTVKIAVFVTRFDENVLSFDVTMIAQCLPKSVQTRCVGSSRNASQIDHRFDSAGQGRVERLFFD